LADNALTSSGPAYCSRHGRQQTGMIGHWLCDTRQLTADNEATEQKKTRNSAVTENADRTVPLITWKPCTNRSTEVDLRLRTARK